MYNKLRGRPGLALGVGLALGLLVGAGMMIGALAASGYWMSRGLAVPETLLHASTAQGADTFAIATGPIDANVEGVFLLDFITGDLQCWILSPRSRRIVGQFKYNVTQDLRIQGGKTPKYLLATGGLTFIGGGRSSQLANTVAYVADASTGLVAAYGVPWDRTRANAGGSQLGQLVLLDGGKARNIEIRE